MERVIVSRHSAAIEFIKREAPGFIDARIVATATAADVAGRIVAGNLPLHLAALASEVVVIEFDTPPRGGEYDLAEMDAAGARLESYRVKRAGQYVDQAHPPWPSCPGLDGPL